MWDIAKIAGVTMGSIYQYFPNKRAIVAELATAYLDDNTRVRTRSCFIARI
jgi:AcrR family transcriptional regulator